ncbi:MAG TPA: hypothetical protein DCP63_06800 [Bacteroidetes bacterium]|nr:hypothetical protein [Bacteroidota bacterium]
MKTIRSKITLTYILLSLVVVSLLGFVLSYEIEKYFYQRLLSQLQTEAATIDETLKDSIRHGESLQRSVAHLHTLSSTSKFRITLIDASGRVLFESWVADSLIPALENHADRKEVVQAREAGAGSDRRHSKSTGEDLVYVALRVNRQQYEGSIFPELGFVRVAVSLREVTEAVGEIRLNVFGAATIVLLVMTIVSQFLAYRISKPLIEISEAVRDIKAGNLNRRLPIRSDDEIGRLAELINSMTETVRDDIEQLKKLERVRSEFLGNVSHELRTPIFSLKGFLETLLDGALDDKNVNRSFVERAYNHASRLDSLLSDLIDISRIESGEMKMSFRYFDITAYLRHLADDLTHEASKKNQTLTLNMPSKEVVVYGDKERLTQALGNILDNAIKYSQAGATIIVSVVENEETVSISVSDSGPGISAEHLPRVFERFYRVDKTRSRDVGGTGLGLAITKHIVEAHGSKIGIESEVGKGTTFSFDLKK